MAKNFLNVDPGLNINPQSSAPSNPKNGDMYYDSTLNQIRIYVNGSWRSAIGSTPAVFTAVRSTNQTGVNTNNSEIKVAFNSALIDTRSGFNTTTNQYTVQSGDDGYLVFSLAIAPLNTNILSGRHDIRIYKNGSIVGQSHNPAFAAGVGEILTLTTQVLDCVAGDVIEARFFGSPNNSASTLTIQSATQVTFFSGRRIN